VSEQMTSADVACTPLEQDLGDYAEISGTHTSLGAARKRVHVPRISEPAPGKPVFWGYLTRIDSCLLVPIKEPRVHIRNERAQSMSETQ